jgi:hypothetical protein
VWPEIEADPAFTVLGRVPNSSSSTKADAPEPDDRAANLHLMRTSLCCLPRKDNAAGSFKGSLTMSCKNMRRVPSAAEALSCCGDPTHR